MFATIQFPFADLRHFVTEETGRLASPPWPLVDAGKHFVRGIGAINDRPRGGVVDWTGEDRHCNAKGAIKYSREKSGPLKGLVGTTEVDPLFRRYFASGNASWPGTVCRLDCSFRNRVSKKHTLREEGLDAEYDFALSCLSIPALVPGITSVRCELSSAGPRLAARLLELTTHTNAVKKTSPWWYQAGRPFVLIETLRLDNQWTQELTSRERSMWGIMGYPQRIADQMFVNILHRSRRVPVWILRYEPSADKAKLRRLRIHLSRLYQEREVLRLVLAACIESRIDPLSSPPLRDYLARQSSRLRRARSHGLPQRDLLAYAYFLDTLVSGSELSALEEVLAPVGTGLAHSVLDLVRAPGPAGAEPQLQPPMLIYMENGEIVVEKKQQIVGPGAIVGALLGDSAQVIGSNIQGSGGPQSVDQDWNAFVMSADMVVLAEELHALRYSLRQGATDATHDVAIAEVAQAEVAAKEGDHNRVRMHLARVGKWVLEAARSIGSDVAAAAIQSALGLK